MAVCMQVSKEVGRPKYSVCIRMCVWIYVRVYMYVHVYVCMYIHVCVCTCVGLYTYILVWSEKIKMWSFEK